MISTCIEMAISDIYSANPTHTTRLEIHSKDVDNLLDVDLAVLELLEQGHVQAILLPQDPSDETFIAHLARKLQIPVISLGPSGSPLSEAQNPYFVRASADDAVQSRALAAVFRRFGWDQVVALYEETELGYQFLSHLSKSLQEAGIGLAHLSALAASSEENLLRRELASLNETQSVKVFLVHASASLGFRLLTLAEKLGMMCEGHAWIITDTISNCISSADWKTRNSMQGVLGVRPSFPLSNDLQNFKEKFQKNGEKKSDLNFYGLRAYDVVNAVANAVEKIRLHESKMRSKNTKFVSLLQELSSHRLDGLSGAFELVNGNLKSSAFDIFNVVGSGERTLGKWTPERGIKELRKVVIWPGDTLNRPNGMWPTPSGILRVGIPCNSSIKVFVIASAFINHTTKEVTATGLAVDVFLVALKMLPMHVDHRFFCFGEMNTSKWSYDDMLLAISDEKYDMVVADTTIWAPRTKFVDFSQPYLESGMILVVRRRSLDKWFFTMPFKWDLWLAMLVSSMLMGLIIWIFERRTTIATDQEASVTNSRISTTFLVPITVLAFQERNMVLNKWSALVLVCWVFMAFVLMQSFTANLSAILTIDQLHFALNWNKYNLGYRAHSFTKTYLTQYLKIDESRLKECSTNEEFHEAMSRGTKNGGIDAIFDEIPYMMLFMNKYKSKYKIMGPTYPADGLAFAFPIGSPLAANFSRAILNITQDGLRFPFKDKYFEGGTNSSLQSSKATHKLDFDDFSILFTILAAAAAFALICSELESLRNMARRLINICSGRANVDPMTNTSEEEHGINGEERESVERDDDGEEIFEDALSKEGDDG